MPKFTVIKREVWTSGIAIDAESELEALNLVRLGNGQEIDTLLEYSHTLDSSTWTVETADSEGGTIEKAK